LGDEKINQVISLIGMNDTSLDLNQTTAKDVGVLFTKLWEGEIVSLKFRDEILDYLTDTIYEDWITAGISDVKVAHKYGREVNVVNDAGIVYSEDPFVLVIMTEGIIEKEADKAIPEIAKGIYEIESHSRKE
jgi:beta-lactamase class A